MTLKYTWLSSMLAVSLASVALAQGAGYEEDALQPVPEAEVPSLASFASSKLFAEGDAPVANSDAPAANNRGLPPEEGYCDACYMPSWSAAADVMFLDRSPAQSATLAENFNTSAEMLNANSMNFNWATGPRLSLIRHAPCMDLEITHFNVTGWLAQGNVTAPPDVLFPQVGGGLTISSGQASFYNTSRLFSTEINLRKNWTPNLTGLVGFRWVEFYDHLQLDIASATARNFIHSNRMYGAQVGLDVALLKRSHFELRSTLKAGIYGNAMQGHFDEPGTPSSDQDLTATHTAFLGDIGLSGMYHLSDCWTVRGGYQLLWIEKIALAPNQLNQINLLTPALSNIDATNSLFAHGATVGLKARF